MEITVCLQENEFKKLIKHFAYRYIINFEEVAYDEYECTLMVEPFMQFVEHHSKTIRIVAIRVLGEAKYKKATDLLIKALHDRSGSVKSAAAYYLGQMQDRTVIKPLLLAMNDHKCDYQALIALRDLLGRDLEPEMVKALSDPDSRICLGAGTVLLNFRHTPDLTTALIKASRHKNYKVRRIAAAALGLGDSISASKSIIASFDGTETHGGVIIARMEALRRLKTQLNDALKEVEKSLKTLDGIDSCFTMNK